MNRTFQELALLKDVQEAWGVLGPQLFGFMNNSANVATLQVGPRRRAADSCADSCAASGRGEGRRPPAEGYRGGKAGQGRRGRTVEAQRGQAPGVGRGDGPFHVPCRSPSSLTALQRLLQIQDRGRGESGPGARLREGALRAFLDSRAGGYSWRAAYADAEQLVGILGRAVEVSGHPLGNSFEGGWPALWGV